MYQCINCHADFDTPRKYVEKHGLDGPPYEEWTCCPYCGGDYKIKPPDKILTFTETLMSDDMQTVFIKGKEYPVTYEDDFTYILGEYGGHKVGIDKSLDGVKYIVSEV